MKVEFFSSHDIGIIEKEINDFCENKKVFDVKFSVDEGFYFALVMYEDNATL